MHTQAMVFVALSLIFLVAIVLVVLKLISRKPNKKTGLFGKKLGLIQSMAGEKGTRTYNGVTYNYKFHPGSKNTPSYFTVSIPTISKGFFTIKKETAFDKFFKRLGICLEITTHDRTFDDKYFIDTQTIGFTRYYFRSRDKRNAIDHIFQQEYNHVIHDGKTMTAKRTPIRRAQLPDEAHIEQTVAYLITLSQQLPPTETPGMDEPPGGAHWKAKRILAYTLPSLLVVIGLIAMGIGLNVFDPLDTGFIFLDSLKIFIPSLLLYIWFAVKLLRGRSSSHHDLMVVAAISLAAFLLASFGLEVFLNGALDNSEPSVHMVDVMSKYSKKKKHDYDYYVYIESWRQGEINEQLEVNKSQFKAITPYSTKVKILTKPGKFGYEWVYDFRFIQPRKK